ncbi:porin [Burkholderia sp. 22PA0099]|uniref:porin n=1 Tax=Burkholderia sp. 22PA0099 TaxID=3237372 RepID=UPI0039C28017
MRPYQIAIATLCSACWSIHVQAQSSVTLYGLIDEGINFTSNAGGHKAWQAVSGSTYGSRWGLRGVEDLGGGLSAVFRLENGFNVNTGGINQGGRLFGRVASVGIASRDYGSVTMGRQYDPTIDLWSPLTATGNWAGDIANHPYDNDNSDYNYRIQNSVKYTSPTISGFTFEGLYGFSNEAGAFADNRAYSLAASYANGPILAAVAYLRANHAGSSNSNGAIGTDSLFVASHQQNIDAGVAYKFAKGQVGVAYSRTEAYDPTALTGFAANVTQPPGGSWNSWKFDNFELNGKYYVRPDWWIGAAYTFTRGHLDSTVGNFSPKWHQIALMLDYDLSKRTSVYVQGTLQHLISAKTGTAFDFAQTTPGAGRSSSENQVVARVGMIHRF